MSSIRAARLVPDSIVGGRYRILGEIGHGGMSVVYRAHDKFAERDVALKVMRLADEDPRNALYLQQEFRSMSRLRHPKLVEVYDYGVIEEQVPYFTMELLLGEDLSTIGVLSLDAIYHVLISLADVLGFMHTRGYVHRDVKPSNVRLLPMEIGNPIDLRLMDCGLTEQQGTHAGSVAGTLSYLAPEVWLGAATDVRGDLYSLGVLAYEITTGQLPFDASTGVRLLKSKTERPKDLRALRPEVPQAFARLVSDLLAPEPANRPASAMEVLARLSKFADVDFSPDPGTYLRTPALVGRAEELAKIRNEIAEAATGKPVSLTIQGPAGAGKTRLLDEALLEAGLRGAWIARGSGRGFAGGAYEVFHELLGPLLALPSADEILSKIGGRALLRPTNRSTVPGGALRETDPINARRSLQQAFSLLLEGLSHHRFLVLAIDDIHLADAASVEVLTGMLGSGVVGNVAVVSTVRTGEPITHSLEYLLHQSKTLELDRLSRRQIGELIAGALGPADPSEELLGDLERATDGNVYFVLEILRDLAARGLIERKRTWVQLPDRLLGLELPTSLSDALQRRISKLSKEAFNLARSCAIVGRDVEYTLGRALVDYDDDAFLDAVDELRRGELLDAQERFLRLHHPRLRDAFLSGLDGEARAALHLRVAREIEQQRREIYREYDAELGYHYAEAGERKRALECYVRAGDARYEGFAYYDAKEAYVCAYELMGEAAPRERLQLERKLNDRLGRICFYHDHQSGPFYLERASRNHLQHGLLWTIPGLSRLLGAPIAVVMAVAGTVLWDVLRGRRMPLRRAFEHLIDSFAATTYLANCYAYSGRFRAAVDASERLLPLVYSRHKLPRAGYLLARAWALVMMNRFDESASACEEVLRILETDRTTPITEQDRIHAVGGALVTRVWVDLGRGHVEHSQYTLPLEQFVRKYPTAMLEAWLGEVQVFIAHRRGNLAATRKAWAKFVKESAQAEVQFVQSKARAWLGMACLDAGHVSEAQDIADEVIAIARAKDNPTLLGLGLQLRGLALRAWEQLSEAEKCFEESATVLTLPDVEATEFYHSVLLCQASLALEMGDAARARELAMHVTKADAGLQLTHDLHRLRVARILGRVALAEGRPDEATLAIGQACEIAKELDDRLELAYSYHCLAQAQTKLGLDDATNSRALCEGILLELGNHYQLRRLGFRGPEEPISSERASLVTKVRALVSEQPAKLANLGTQTAFDEHEPWTTANSRDETLPAIDSQGDLLAIRGRDDKLK